MSCTRCNVDGMLLWVLTPIKSDEMSFLPTSLHQESSRAYSGNVYEDSFSDTTSLVETIPAEQHAPPEAASIDRDNKLLSFHLPGYNFTLLDYSLRRTSLSLTAQLHGMFFMAESPSLAAVDTTSPPAELTCYRRNLFQITGSITLPRTLRYILTDQGDRIPILAQELTISATESVEGHPVKLISVPWKTPASNATSTPEERTEKEPTSIILDTMSNQDMDADYATFPIAWKRLQFRIATANNGRRKELQQHFVVKLKVMATLSTGAKISICEAKSGAIIVRGRSPRNFQQRKDFPVGNTGGSGRKGMHPPPLTRNTTSDSGPPSASLKTEAADTTAFSFDQQDMQTPTTHGDWTNYRRGGSRTALPPPAADESSPANSKSPSAGPQPLSITDNDMKRPPPRKALRTTKSVTAALPSPFKHPSFASSAVFLSTNSQHNLPEGLDSADLLYEYFPLGLDDWMPPVDAVYRPHVVHHVNAGLGSGLKTRPGLTGKSKRYFSEDQS